MTMIKGIAENEWEKFLHDFSVRNRGRRSRFEFFAKSNVQEEEAEGHLETITLETIGKAAPRLLIKRRDESGTEVRELVETIPAVRRLLVQLDTDGSEDALEIEDPHGKLVLLRMESKVDGAS